MTDVVESREGDAAPVGAGDEPEAVARAILDAACELDADSVIELFANDVIWGNPPLPPFRGKEKAGRMLHRLVRILSYYDYQDATFACQGEKVFVERIEILGFGSLRIAFPVTAVITVNDGKVKVWQDYYDSNTFALKFMLALLRWPFEKLGLCEPKVV